MKLKKRNHGKEYAWSFSKYGNNYDGPYSSFNECLIAAIEANQDDNEFIYIGEISRFEPYVCAEVVLEELENAALDFGRKWEAYNYSGDRKQLNKLSKELTAVVHKWLKEEKRYPYFCAVENILALKSGKAGEVEDGEK